MKKTPNRTPSTTTVRLPAELHHEIKQAAARAGHSMNVEIIERLSARPAGLTLTDLARQNAKLAEMIQKLVDGLL